MYVWSPILSPHDSHSLLLVAVLTLDVCPNALIDASLRSVLDVDPENRRI